MKRFIGVAIMAFFFTIIIAPAEAVTPVQPVLAKKCYPIIIGDRIESYKAWQIRIDGVNGLNFCYNYKKTRFDSYTAYLVIARGSQKAGALNAFDKRVQACKVGETTFLLGDIKCLFRVSFFPTSEPIRLSWNNISKSFTNNQPMSYIPVGFKTIKSAFNSMGGSECNASNGNALRYEVGLPTVVKKMNFLIPCKPPVALRVFRGILVSILYLGFAFWLYSVALKWWSARESS